ncbi:hypothetical protein M1O55_04100, partial [Dehalococcoidia bacterium]|nr:hypothetical protein [Dehalococcoidia bacterium]
MMIEPLEIGTRKQLFIDDLVIEETHGTTKTLNQPTKYVGNPIVIPLYPWEGRIGSLSSTVIRDAQSGQFRMWYLSQGGMGVPSMSSSQPYSIQGNDPKNLHLSICYATSNDGIFWDRPNLSLVEYKGSKDNNIAIPNASGANVFEDTREPDPARRYKSLFFELHGPDGTPNMGDGVSVAFSPDGVKWTKYEQNPVITRSSDSHTLFGWDDLHGKYVSYCRPSLHEGNKIRRIGRAVSDDFVNWTVPEDVLVPDDDDPPGMEFYGMPVFKYEDLYIGQLWAYQTRPEEPQIRFAGSIHVQLAGSRDGRVWERLGGRKPFIPNGPPGSIDHWETMTAQSPVVMGDELWFYYCGTASEHGFTGRSGPICLAKLRLDGFVSLDAGDETGTLVTKPFLCEGDLLRINASARNGMVGVAVLDESGTQYQGYSRQECAL